MYVIAVDVVDAAFELEMAVGICFDSCCEWGRGDGGDVVSLSLIFTPESVEDVEDPPNFSVSVACSRVFISWSHPFDASDMVLSEFLVKSTSEIWWVFCCGGCCCC